MTMTYNQCLDAILKVAKENPKNSGLQYAASYAEAAYGMTGREREVQILYILNNLSTWRGDEARKIKAELKLIAEDEKNARLVRDANAFLGG